MVFKKNIINKMSKITGIVIAKNGDQYTITDSAGKNYTTRYTGISIGDNIIFNANRKKASDISIIGNVNETLPDGTRVIHSNTNIYQTKDSHIHDGETISFNINRHGQLVNISKEYIHPFSNRNSAISDDYKILKTIFSIDLKYDRYIGTFKTVYDFYYVDAAKLDMNDIMIGFDRIKYTVTGSEENKIWTRYEGRTNKLRCINDPTKFYLGSQNSPRGLGYAASGFNVGKELNVDGTIWKVHARANGVKYWRRVSGGEGGGGGGGAPDQDQDDVSSNAGTQIQTIEELDATSGTLDFPYQGIDYDPNPFGTILRYIGFDRRRPVTLANSTPALRSVKPQADITSSKDGLNTNFSSIIKEMFLLLKERGFDAQLKKNLYLVDGSNYLFQILKINDPFAHFRQNFKQDPCECCNLIIENHIVSMSSHVCRGEYENSLFVYFVQSNKFELKIVDANNIIIHIGIAGPRRGQNYRGRDDACLFATLLNIVKRINYNKLVTEAGAGADETTLYRVPSKIYVVSNDKFLDWVASPTEPASLSESILYYNRRIIQVIRDFHIPDDWHWDFSCLTQKNQGGGRYVYVAVGGGGGGGGGGPISSSSSGDSLPVISGTSSSSRTPRGGGAGSSSSSSSTSGGYLPASVSSSRRPPTGVGSRGLIAGGGGRGAGSSSSSSKGGYLPVIGSSSGGRGGGRGASK